MNPDLHKIKLEFAQYISSRLGISVDDAFSQIIIPKNINRGIFSFPCFKVSKIKNISPNELAKQLCGNNGQRES